MRRPADTTPRAARRTEALAQRRAERKALPAQREAERAAARAEREREREREQPPAPAAPAPERRPASLRLLQLLAVTMPLAIADVAPPSGRGRR